MADVRKMHGFSIYLQEHAAQDAPIERYGHGQEQGLVFQQLRCYDGQQKRRADRVDERQQPVRFPPGEGAVLHQRVEELRPVGRAGHQGEADRGEELSPGMGFGQPQQPHVLGQPHREHAGQQGREHPPPPNIQPLPGPREGGGGGEEQRGEQQQRREGKQAFHTALYGKGSVSMINGKKIVRLGFGRQKATEALPRIRELLGINGTEPGNS